MKSTLIREKMSKKQRKELDREGRVFWAVPPVTKRIENKKKKKLRSCRMREDDSTAFCFVGK